MQLWTKILWSVFIALVFLPELAFASESDTALHLSKFWLVPFGVAVIILILAESIHWCEKRWTWRNRILIGATLVIPTVLRIATIDDGGLLALEHQVIEYIQFLSYAIALYFVALGIVQTAGDLKAHPLINTLIIATGLIGSNAIGSGGYGILVAIVLLESNKERKYTWQTFMAVIYMVCNTMAQLFAQSDAPIYLMKLQGLPYLWPVKNLWAPMLFLNLILLTVYLLADSIQYYREDITSVIEDDANQEGLRFKGVVGNLLLCAVIVISLIGFTPELTKQLIGYKWGITETILVLCAIYSSMLVSPIKGTWRKGFTRHGKPFSFSPILGVVYVFGLLFFTVIPWKAEVKQVILSMGLTNPGDFYIVFGIFSTFMDNAIAEVLGVATAVGLPEYVGVNAVILLKHAIDPAVIAAILMGTVGMGAFLSFSNWPNIIVYIMAKQYGVKMPTPAGFLLLSCFVLAPSYALTWYCFFHLNWIAYFVY